MLLRVKAIVAATAVLLSAWVVGAQPASADEPDGSVALPIDGLELRQPVIEIGGSAGSAAHRIATVRLSIVNVSGEPVTGPLRFGLDWSDAVGWLSVGSDGLSHQHRIVEDHWGALFMVEQFPADGELVIVLQARLGAATADDGAFDLHFFTSRAAPTDVPDNCAAPQGEWIGCVPFGVELPLHQVSVEKSATAVRDDAGIVTAVDYTVVARNDGLFEFGAAEPPVVVDDLRGVLDDGELDGTPTASAGSIDLSTPGALRWSGPIAAGDAVELNYRVAIDPAATLAPEEAGDRSARNVVRAFNRAADITEPITCVDPAEVTCAATTTPLDPVVASIELAASATEVDQGESITLSATGFAAGGDELGDVTDALTVTSDVETDVVDGTTVRFPTASSHVITGTLPNGVSASVTVTVRPSEVPAPPAPSPEPTGTSVAAPQPARPVDQSDGPLPGVGGPTPSISAIALALIALGLFVSAVRPRPRR